jgi:ATP-dependent exoDNAse (exonuclease V) beta subunit
MTAAMMGTLAHKVIEILPAPTRDRPQADGESEIEAAIREALRILNVSDPSPVGWEADLKRWMQHYVRSEHYLGATEEEWFNELRFSLPLGGYLVEGVIDRVSLHKNGTIALFDFKTNRLRDPHDFSQKVNQYLPQLRIYALAVERMWGQKPDRAVLYFLDRGNIYEERIDLAWMEEARRETEQLLRKMKNCKHLQDYPVKPGAACKSCAYRTICKAVMQT